MQEEKTFCKTEGEVARVEGEHLHKQAMMRRRALRRHPAVKQAVDLFWTALGPLKVAREYIPKDVYLTYHLKIARALDGTDYTPRTLALREKQRREESEHDWISDCRKARILDQDNTAPADAIGYVVFYDSLFEVPDKLTCASDG